MHIYREALLKASVLFLVSWTLCATGIFLGHRYLDPGPGYNGPSGIHQDLFRFDSEYYYSIADSGYSYNGDPSSSPNIVFAPLFPLLIQGVDLVTGVGLVSAGFLLNKILLLFGFMFLLLALQCRFSSRESFMIVLALATAAGSYSLHAYYSESTMLFFLSLAMYCEQRAWWPGLALATAGLGASRVAALPMVAVFAGLLLAQAFRVRDHRRRALKFVLLAGLSVSGLVFYFGYVAMKFGNPFELFAQIQQSSWALFHQSAWPGWLWGEQLLQDWGQAVGRGSETLYDIKTMNLLWTTVALMAAISTLVQFRRQSWSWLFASYFIFIYVTSVGSDYLISAHRLYLFMLPIFMLFVGLHRRLEQCGWRILARACSGCFLAFNVAYGLIHSAFFNQGIWYYF